MRLILILLGITLVGALQGQAQAVNYAWRDYVRALYDSAEEKQFVSVYFSSGDKLEKAYFCFRENDGAQMVAVNFGDTAFRQLNLPDPKIFQYILTNRKHIQSVRDYYINRRRSLRAVEDSADVHLAIKIPGFHFNHFVKVPEAYIARLKGKRVAESFRAVNTLLEMLEDGVKKALAKTQD